MSKSIEQAEEALKAAKAAYMNELSSDSERREGSDAQERRREEHQERLCDQVAKCERELEDARANAIDEITEMLAHTFQRNINVLQDEALQASKNEDYYACKKALGRQAREIDSLLKFVECESTRR